MQNEIQSAVGFAHAKPEKAAELGALLVDFAERSRTEPGCLGSWINQDAQDPNLFVFYEIWATRKDLARHLGQSYMKEFLDGRDAYLQKELEVRPLTLAGTPGQDGAETPAEMNQKYLDAYAARDIDAIMAVYAPGAAAVWEPGKAVSGDEHRAAVCELL
ncbi:antibiotic biosynthesis monooxygenase [Streptomyces sp. NPDC059627]